MVLVSGPPGIGKSRLASEFIEEVTAEGTIVLVGRSWEAGGAPPYWPWVQTIRSYFGHVDSDALLDLLGEGAPVMKAMFPELGELSSGTAPPLTDPDAERFRLFDATARFLCNAAKSSPLVIVLEDLQAADVPTLLLLQFVAAQLSECGVLIVATYRDIELTPEHPLTHALSELNRAPVTVQMPLAGLDADEVARFVEAAVGPAASSTLTATLHMQTNGNPLFLGETVRLLAAGTDGELSHPNMIRASIPVEIRAVIERRLEGLSSQCRRVLDAVSVLGKEFDVEVGAHLTEESVDDLLDHLGEAVAAGLLIEARSGPGTFAFAHDLIRHTLHALLAPAQRIRLHRRAAEVLEEAYSQDRGEHIAELALHHFEAVAGGDHHKAVEYGRKAGEMAIRRLAYEEAVRLFELTVQVIEGSEEDDGVLYGHLLLDLGDARVRAGDLPGAEKAFLRAAGAARRLGDARMLARAAIGYGGRFILARAGGDTEMVPLLQDALVLLGGEDDALRVRLLSRLACATRSIGDRDHGAALARQGLDLARQLGDSKTIAYALAALAGATWWPENPEDRLELGRELVSIGEAQGSAEAVVDGHMTRCAALVELGDFPAARRELDLLSHVGGPLRLQSHRWLEGAMRALFALSDGVFEEVEGWIEEMLRQAPSTPARDNISAALFQRFLLRREQGRLPEIEDSARRAAAEFTWYPIHRVALADLLVKTGPVSEARAILNELAADGFSGFHRDNYWLASMCLAAEVVIALDERDLAGVLGSLLEPFAHLSAVAFPEGSLGSVARYLGILAACRGDHDAAVDWYEKALESNRANVALPLVAHTHHDLAVELLARGGDGDEREARSHLDLARRLCDELGLGALGDALQDLADVPGPELESGQSLESDLAAFLREGEYFSVVFEGVDFKIKDSKGLRYLAMLLAAPGREIHALDLVTGASGVDPSLRGTVTPYDDRDITVGTNSPVIDRSARVAYQHRLAELEDDIAEADRFGDHERASIARGEQAFLVRELASALGLDGRDRMAVSAAERARVNVTRAIRSSLAKIDSYSPVLGRHLDATIRTGVFCAYVPDPQHPIDWRT